MKWDANFYKEKHSFSVEYGQALLEYVPENPDLFILDLGCGTGELTKKLSLKSDHVCGIDSSPDMIGKARQSYPELSFEVVDALEWHEEEKWDVVFSNAAIHWIRDHERLLTNIHRGLKEDGLFICECGGAGNIRRIERAFRAAMEKRGRLYASQFIFPETEGFRRQLEDRNFHIQYLHSFQRPTPLWEGEKGLRNWVEQFYSQQLASLSREDRNDLLKEMEEELREALWNGSCWVADYQRLRVVARKKKKAKDSFAE